MIQLLFALEEQQKDPALLVKALLGFRHNNQLCILFSSCCVNFCSTPKRILHVRRLSLIFLRDGSILISRILLSFSECYNATVAVLCFPFS